MGNMEPVISRDFGARNLEKEDSRSPGFLARVGSFAAKAAPDPRETQLRRGPQAA